MFVDKLNNKDFKEFLKSINYKLKNSDSILRTPNIVYCICEPEKIEKQIFGAVCAFIGYPSYNDDRVIYFDDYICYEEKYKAGGEDADYTKEWQTFLSKHFDNYKEFISNKQRNSEIEK